MESVLRVTRAFPIVISGPSGAGKTTVVDSILARDSMLEKSVSATTRPPRGDEVEGEAYFFVSTEQFEALKKGKLVEWARVHGHLYGTPKDFVDSQLTGGKDVVLNIDVQGGSSVKKAFAETVRIFILTPSPGDLEERIRGRDTDLSEDIKKRLENASEEIKRAAEYDYIIVNDRLEDTVAAVLAVIHAERHRSTRYNEDFIQRLKR